MNDEVRASPTELGRVAEVCLTESMALFDGLADARDGWTIDQGAMGNTDAAGEVAEAHTTLTEEAGTAAERLITVLEQTMEDLHQTAFAFLKQDRDNAAQIPHGDGDVPV